MIRLDQVSKSYADKQAQRLVLDQVDWEFAPGQLYTLTGRSGAGKSSLLNILGGLDRNFSGQLWFAGQELSQFSATQMARYRREQVGFVFQDFHLLDALSILDNVLLSTRFLPNSVLPALRQRALDCLKKVDLQGREGDKPGHLSGGERQRVALARALLHQPKLVLADEPTGNLDKHTAATILDLLKALTQEQKITVIMASHDEAAMQCADQVLSLSKGRLQTEAQS